MKYRLKRWVLLFMVFLSILQMGYFLHVQTQYHGSLYYFDYYLNHKHGVDIADYAGTNAEILDLIYVECGGKGDSYYARCLNNFVYDNHHYVPTRGAVPFERLLVDGGDCEGWSKLYYEALKLDGWDVRYVTVPNHVFVVGHKGRRYCTFDQGVMSCNYLDGFYNDEY